MCIVYDGMLTAIESVTYGEESYWRSRVVGTA